MSWGGKKIPETKQEVVSTTTETINWINRDEFTIEVIVN